MQILTLKQAKRIITAVIGFTILLCGVALIFTPGPGLIVILVGLGLLSAEFVWARRLLKRIKTAGTELSVMILGKGATATPAEKPPAAPQ